MKEHSEPSKEEPNWVIKYNGFNDGMCPSSGVGGGPSFNEWDDKLKQLKSMKENKEETKLQSEQKTAEEIDYTKGYKRRIIELVRNNPFESECDIIDVVLGVKEILNEFASQFKSQLPIEQKCSFQDQCDSEPLAYKEQFCGCHNHISQLKQEFVDYYVRRREYQNMEDSLRGMFDKFVLPHLRKK